MKKTITRFSLCLAALLLFVFSGTETVKASHSALISNLTYVNVAPNIYMVNYKIYMDCNAGLPVGTYNLTYRAPGCDSTARVITMAFQSGSVVPGNPYCTSTTLPPCYSSNGSLPYFEERIFSATVTLPGQCNNWILSVGKDFTRTRSRNLINPGTQTYLYAEALINNLATSTNSSPGFGASPIAFAGVDKAILYHHGTTETDGDSVVYNLVPALTDLNTPVVYGNYTGINGIPAGANPYPAGTSPAGTSYPSGIFSGLNPLISTNPLPLDRLTGAMVFLPLEFVGSGVNYREGRDRYLVALKVEEYRKINGVFTKVGHVYRELMVFVYDTGLNHLPYIDSITVNGYVTRISANSFLPAVVGQPLTITLKPHDNNPVDVLTLASNVASALPGATFTISGGARPTGTITWTPSASHVRSAPYFFTVTATDNACPVKGSQRYLIGLRVNNTGGISGIGKALPAGSFVAYPNPTNGPEVTFKITSIKTGINAEVVIYNLTGKVVDRLPVRAGEEQVVWQKRSDLPSGVYFARYASATGTQTVKLMHQK